MELSSDTLLKYWCQPSCRCYGKRPDGNIRKADEQTKEKYQEQGCHASTSVAPRKCFNPDIMTAADSKDITSADDSEEDFTLFHHPQILPDRKVTKASRGISASKPPGGIILFVGCYATKAS
ncbi:hypothetical protein BaRGS_00009586 [Batillaria attramentaria]|uniref:Uncharacterized protein n=1 Tax=Batillaria attramentaria TaxID=370345 RepID=A0ABD0LHS1_9CAEN